MILPQQIHSSVENLIKFDQIINLLHNRIQINDLSFSKIY
jgi:hypothetical protein